MGAAQAMKRIPRIKFPQRHLKPSGSSSQHQEASHTSDGKQPYLFARSTPSTPSSMSLGGGKVSLQPKRTPLSAEEIEAILLGGCI